MSAQPAKILVVDDDRTQLTALSLTLERQGYEVVPAQSSEEALQALEDEAPDLLLLDILMPRVDGIALLKRIKADARWRDLPILMISVLSPEEAAVTSLSLGAADFIPKPFRADELAARIAAQLRASRMLREAREEAKRAAIEASVRAEMLDILHEVTEAFAPEDIYVVLARRVRHALRISRCSIVLVPPGASRGRIVVAADDPSIRNKELDLAFYPEIQQALGQDRAVFVRDVWTDPLFAEVRADWERRRVDVRTRSAIVVPFGMHGIQTGVFFLRTLQEEPPLEPDVMEFAERVIRTAVGVIEKAYRLETVQSAKERYEWLAATDPLTGCANRRALIEVLERELERVRRYGSPLSIVMIDLDFFKRVNDDRGHLVGDDVLRQMGGMLKAQVRGVDTVARYGGEEFVLLLPETALEGAMTFAERFRQRIEQQDFSPDGRRLSITASVGVTMIPGGEIESPDNALNRADAALYRAKRAGRNLVRT